jgi:ABC-2 type transport system ATP-binding protein
MIQRLQLGLALMHEPKLLILDEPMSGLDPAGQRDLKDLLHRLENYTMLYSSHILHDIEDICDRVIFFHQGELVSDLKLSEQEQEIFQMDTTDDIFNILESIEDVRIREVQNRGNFIRIEFKTRQGIFQNIITQCRKENIPVLRIKSKSILEDIYSKYITQIS